MVFEQIILAEVPRLLRYVEIGIDAIVSELVELFHDYAVVLFDDHLALFDEIVRKDGDHVVEVELEELEDVLQRIDEVVKVHAELVDEERLYDLVVEEESFGEAIWFYFLSFC